MHVLSPGRNSPVFRHYWSAPPKKRVLEAIRRGFIRRTFPPGTSRHGKQNFLRRRPKVERLHDAQSLPEIQRLTFSRQREDYSREANIVAPANDSPAPPVAATCTGTWMLRASTDNDDATIGEGAAAMAGTDQRPFRTPKYVPGRLVQSGFHPADWAFPPRGSRRNP